MHGLNIKAPLYLCLGDYVELKPLVHCTGAGLRQVALVEDETASTETAWATQLLHPLGPFWVEMAIWFLIFRLENANDFLKDKKGNKIKS